VLRWCFSLDVMPAKAGIHFDFFSWVRRSRASAVASRQRVTFFAGAKKVTKETPFRI
jgi:hypothetical protein